MKTFYPSSAMHQHVEFDIALWKYLELNFEERTDWSKMPTDMQSSLIYMAQSIMVGCVEYADDGSDPLEYSFLGGLGEEYDSMIEDFIDSLE